ncbi:hypothetical protein [Bradyrhizobium sp. USDA 4529]
MSHFDDKTAGRRFWFGRCDGFGQRLIHSRIAENYSSSAANLLIGGHRPGLMTDTTAQTARLMKVTEAIVAELNRQGVAEAVADLGFDPLEMARVAIRAADGDVVPFRRPQT